MTTLDISVHNSMTFSVKDNHSSLDISDSKWNNLIAFLCERTEGVYFCGFRLSYETNPLASIGYVAEELLYMEGEDLQEVLVSVKDICIINRGLLSQLWKAYDEPTLIFLASKEEQQTLIVCMDEHRPSFQMIRKVSGLYMLYREYEPDVLWIRSNFEDPSFLMAIKEIFKFTPS